MSRNSCKTNTKRLKRWLNSYQQVSEAVQQHGDIVELLQAGGGICKISSFLPAYVAEGILEILEQCDESQWNVTAAGDDYVHNNIAHDFLSTKSQTLEAIFRVFTLVLPDSLFTFSAAKYCKAGHIKPHDDRAYTQVRMEDGSIQLCSRNIALIYYLTKDWTAADGGALIDHEAPGGPQTHIPEFNSVICFTIPRWHEVTPVVADKPRYSIFGWFLEPGKLYDLQLDPQPPGQLQQQDQQQQQQQQKKKKQKKNSSSQGAKHGTAAAKQPHRLPVSQAQGIHKVEKRRKHRQPQQQASAGLAYGSDAGLQLEAAVTGAKAKAQESSPRKPVKKSVTAPK